MNEGEENSNKYEGTAAAHAWNHFTPVDGSLTTVSMTLIQSSE